MTRAVLILAAVGAIAGGPAQAADAPGEFDLALPRPVAAGEAVWLQIRTGQVARGARIRARKCGGEVYGVVSPYGGAQGQTAAAYTVPLPNAAIASGRVRLCIEVEDPGGRSRAPSPDEVEGVEVVYAPVDD